MVEAKDEKDYFAPGGARLLASMLSPTDPVMIRSAQVKVIAWALSHDISKSDMFEVMFTLGIHPEQIKNNTGIQQ